MHRYHPHALHPEQVRDLRDRAATARPGGQASRPPATQSASLVCLHASARSGGQWHALQRRLNGRYQVLSPDLYGSGNSPP